MRLCSKCGVSKEETEFHMRTDKKILHRECKKCAILRGVTRRRKIKDEAIVLLGGKCFDCGQVYHRDVYDFHHLDPAKKTGDPGSMAQRSKGAFFNEIKNCVLLCANCHRLRHSEVA